MSATCNPSKPDLENRLTPSQSTQDRAVELGAKIDSTVHKGTQVLQGKIPDSEVAMGHPIHPATVHWPIAFLSAAFGITTLSLLPAHLYPSSILPATTALPSLAFYSAAAGTITAIPAIVTGLGEGYELIRADYKQRGSWSEVVSAAWNLSDVAGQKVKKTITHASMNDLVVGLGAYNWYHGWKYPNTRLPNAVLAANAIALPALLYSAMLGGKLVYEYAVGVQRQGEGKAVKEKSQ